MAKSTRRFEAYFRKAIDHSLADDGTFRAGMSTTLVTNSLFGMRHWTHRWFVPGKSYAAYDLLEVVTTVFFEGTNDA